MFADQFGLEIDYQKIDAGPDEFPEALEAFHCAGGTGCNITMPLKNDAWQLAVGSSPQVGHAQAANTLVYQTSGWFAHNTDGVGLVADLTRNHALGLNDRRILILGAGGATAGILGELLAAKPREIMLVNRSLERAHALAQRFDSLGAVKVTAWAELAQHGGFDLVINATSLGHQGKTPPLLESIFAKGSVCYDLNYYKASLPLKSLCESIGQRYIDGLGMLVEQAVASFQIWTGRQAEGRMVMDNLRNKNL